MTTEMTINRELSEGENYSGRALKQGETVYLYHGCTYGCITSRGAAVTFVEDETPFFEVPEDALTPKSEEQP